MVFKLRNTRLFITEVWGMVIFSQTSAILSTGLVCIQEGGLHLEGGPHPGESASRAVCIQERGLHPGSQHPGWGLCPGGLPPSASSWADPPPSDTIGYFQQAAGAHPPGMHSCFYIVTHSCFRLASVHGKSWIRHCLRILIVSR